MVFGTTNNTADLLDFSFIFSEQIRKESISCFSNTTYSSKSYVW